jgi:large subunit ribosomal protein L25
MQIEVNAQPRQAQGTGASRRLRRDGKVPGIVYGGKDTPVVIELDHNELMLQLRKEAFHASILTLVMEGAKQQVLLRALNMHPWKPQIQHVDFQRVLADQKIHMKVPLHFINAEASPAVKLGGALVSHVMNEVNISCLPADLPEFIEVDLKDMQVGQTLHVSDVPMPKGVEPVLHRGENPVVAAAVVPRAAAAEEETAAAEAAPAASAVPAAKQPEKPEAGKTEEKKK